MKRAAGVEAWGILTSTGREYMQHLVPDRPPLLTQYLTLPSYGESAITSVHSKTVESTMACEARAAVPWFNAWRDASRNADDVGTNVGGTALAGCCWAVITGLRGTQ
jgi:hypothetical protein